MLKIKDNVDLKELEKFGFKYEKNCWGFPCYTKTYTEILVDDRIICPSEYMIGEEAFNEEDGFDEVYDLIKANLTEKIERTYE